MRITCMAGSSMQIGVRNQRQETRALDRFRELTLVAGGGAADARRDDLAGLVDEVLQHFDVLVVDPLDLVGGEAAELAAAEKRPLPFVLLVLAELPFAFSFASAWWWHLYSPSTNSIVVTCSTSFLARLLFALRKPSTRTALPSGRPASSRACDSKATAPSSACPLRRPPARPETDSAAPGLPFAPAACLVLLRFMRKLEFQRRHARRRMAELAKLKQPAAQFEPVLGLRQGPRRAPSATLTSLPSSSAKVRSRPSAC